MDWTWDKPTTPGWYVVHCAPDPYFRKGTCRLVYIYIVDGFLRIEGLAIEDWHYKGPYYGPLADPPQRETK